MKKLTQSFGNVVIMLIITLLVFNSGANAQTIEKYYLDGQLFVKFHDNYDPQIPVATDRSVNISDATYFAGIFSKHEVISISRPLDANNDIKLLRTFLLTFRNHHALEEIISELEKKPEIDYAEKVAMHYTDHIPNDSLYNLINGASKWKWHLDVVNARQAWDITKGAGQIRIAIVDNAVWSNHPDLASKIVLQFDVTNNVANSNPPGTGDPGDWSHGTHCAGLAAAATNNRIGVAALGYNSSIIAVKAATTVPNSITHSYQGVNYAVNNGANVVSMSFGSTSYNQTFQNLVNAGTNMGIVFLASAGNEGTNQIRYPAGYTNVIAVASTNDNDVKSNFSSFGTYVSICAPGGFASPGPSGLLSTVFSTTSMGNYDSFYGTSMATPLAAGLAGLMKSINPNLSPADLKAVMQATCVNIDAINPNHAGQLGAGRINAFEAVKAVPFNPIPAFSTPVSIILPGQSINFFDDSKGVPSTWNWTFTGGNPSTSNVKNPTGITYATPGTYAVTLVVQNAYGTQTLTKNGYITVTATPKPFIQFEPSATVGCIFDPITIQDNTLYNPLTWNWSFQPATYQFVNGTTASSQHPVVIFTAPGLYNVVVTSTNANGSSTTTLTDYFNIDGMSLPFEEDFESGTSDHLVLSSNSRAYIKVDMRSAASGLFGLHFTGASSPTGWVGSPTGTTPEQAWNNNIDFQAFAKICNVDATAAGNLTLKFDLRQTFSVGNKSSWLRVLVNDTIQIADNTGTLNFTPTTNTDPFVNRVFDLTDFAGTAFSLTFQSSCRLHDMIIAQGDNVFIDNIVIESNDVGVPGDSNCDGMVNVLDVVATISYIMQQNPNPFCFDNADVVPDQMINVLDVVATVNIIMSGKKHSASAVNSAPVNIFMTAEGIEIESDGTLAGLQFDLEGVRTNNVEFLLKGFEFSHANLNNTMRGLVFSFDNSPLPSGRIQVLRFIDQRSDFRFGEVIAANINASQVPVQKNYNLNQELSGSAALSIFPNPVTDETIISYRIAQESHVNISVYSMQGKLLQTLVNTDLATGEYQLRMESGKLSPGIYICRAELGNETIIKKIILMK